MTRTELGSAFKKAGINAEGLRLGYFMMSAELDGVICSGARRGQQITYALPEERVQTVKAISRDEALAKLVKRYFKTRGPATLQDFTWWSMLTMADGKNGIEMVKSRFEHEEMTGQTYWFLESGFPAKEKSSTMYLFPNYDDYFIGFKDRSAIGEVAKRVGITGDDPALIAHIIILDGQIVSGWRRTLINDEVFLEASLITRLSKTEEHAITVAAVSFGKFLGFPISVSYNEHTIEPRKTRSL